MLKLGSYLEATPAYKAAVKAQQAKDAERRLIETEAAKVRQAAVRRDLEEKAYEELKARKDWAHDILKAAWDRKSPAVEDIIEAIAFIRLVSVDALRSDTQRRDVVDARQEAYVLIRQNHPKISMRTIGGYFNKDHSSVKNALKRAKTPTIKPRRIDRDAAMRLVKKGLTAREIGAMLGFSFETVYKATNLFKKPTMSLEQRAILDQAIKLRADGMSFVKMSKVLNVNRQTLRRYFIITGRML